MSHQIKVLVVGAGSRGTIYADEIRKLGDRARIVGVVEPREDRRCIFAEKHGLTANQCFANWSDPLERDRIADVVIIATPDHLHVEPTVAYAESGYHILLEKPMAPTVDGCIKLYNAVQKAGVIFAVCHVLRYAPYTQKLKALIDVGVIGRPISVQHLEPVGYWHYAHSFVRGNWRNEANSSFMLLAKSCHDLDWLSYIMGALPKRVSSFGNLSYFTAENAPQGATERCLDCPVEAECIYSAKRIYHHVYEQGYHEWPIGVLATDISPQGIDKALRDGPYGRCVYHCDNDVVDHQVVNIEFDGGQTAAFVMTAFTRPAEHRKTRIFGTHGEIYCDCHKIEVVDFFTEQVTTHDVTIKEGDQSHAGGDGAMIERLISVIEQNDAQQLLSGADQALATHLSVFAAEQSRRTGQIVELKTRHTAESAAR